MLEVLNPKLYEPNSKEAAKFKQLREVAYIRLLKKQVTSHLNQTRKSETIDLNENF